MRRSLPRFAQGAAGSLSLLLRLASLAGKLGLSLYMGKFFPLAELGLYGLAFGAVMLAIVIFGFRIDYIVAREILGMDRQKQREVGTTVGLIYVLSFVAAAPIALAALFLEGGGKGIQFLLLVYLLCGVEAYANFLYTVTIALKRPALANALFFIRSGLWTAPAIVVSYLRPDYRTVDFVIFCWLAGAGASVLLNLWVMRSNLLVLSGWRTLPWKMLALDIRKAALVWIGSIGITLGAYVDRFVLASFLSLDDVGVATFYTSFTAAALTLVQSATTSVTFPQMIQRYDEGDQAGYRDELRRTAKLALWLGLLILIGLAGAMFVLGQFMDKPELVAAYPTFLLLLFATFARTHGETLYYGLFVERKHRAIWLGNLMFLGASLSLNLALIPLFGLPGLGISAISSAVLITGWRAAKLRQSA
jgi:O-antigen/teichoic acid export membrane protein